MSKIASDVIIVTSSLTKDMTGKEDQFRAGAIMALCAITDVSTVTACVVSQQPCVYVCTLLLGNPNLKASYLLTQKAEGVTR